MGPERYSKQLSTYNFQVHLPTRPNGYIRTAVISSYQLYDHYMVHSVLFRHQFRWPTAQIIVGI